METEVTEIIDSSNDNQVEEKQPTPEEIADWKKKAEVSSQNYERAKKAEEAKKALEEKIAQLENADDNGDDNQVSQKLAELNAKFAMIEENSKFDGVIKEFPVLADKRQEFDEYRAEYTGVPIDKVAKLFVAEKGLNEKPKKGLERAGGGMKTAPAGGKMSAEDVKRLRENNYKQYLKLVKEGKIEV